jgi:hypothetical protein
MKKLSTLIASIALLTTFAAPLATASPVAASNESALCEGSGGTWKADKDLPNGGACTSGAGGRTVAGTLQQLTDVLIFLLGGIAVIMIIIGGLRYVTSAGDQTALASAKNTVLYSLIGLIVAFMAYAVVKFIFAAFNIK